MASSSSEVSRLLDAWHHGSTEARDELIPHVYKELRRIAGGLFKKEPSGHTLQPTAVVHEALINLTGGSEVRWRSQAAFLGIAAEEMRRILIDYARRRKAKKRGGGDTILALDKDFALPENLDLVALEDALQALAKFDLRLSRIVELRFFGGLMHQEIAEVLGMGVGTVKKDWGVARLWLRRELSPG